jgi:hypothetical protein
MISGASRGCRTKSMASTKCSGHRKPNSLHNTVVISNAYNLLMAFKYANSYKFSRIVAEKRELCWKAPMDWFVKVN